MAQSPEFGWGDLAKVRPPDQMPGVMPDPFYDSTGFPISLVRVRDQARERSGDITRDGDQWLISHPDPDSISMRVRFYPDGYVTVRVTDNAVVETRRKQVTRYLLLLGEPGSKTSFSTSSTVDTRKLPNTMSEEIC